jgi:hypothetical protein
MIAMARTPLVVLVMRHAEKPVDPSDAHLSPAGMARANAIADYVPRDFGTPDFIFASAISKHSARPYETVAPLSKRVGVPLDTTIADQDYGYLAAELMSSEVYAAKRIVVCWHHGNIPSLVRALGARAGDYPDPWDPAVFNLILKVEFPGEHASVAEILEPF